MRLGFNFGRRRLTPDQRDPAEEPEAPPRVETEEEAKARKLVERIAREVDEEMERESR